MIDVNSFEESGQFSFHQSPLFARNPGRVGIVRRATAIGASIPNQVRDLEDFAIRAELFQTEQDPIANTHGFPAPSPTFTPSVVYEAKRDYDGALIGQNQNTLWPDGSATIFTDFIGLNNGVSGGTTQRIQGHRRYPLTQVGQAETDAVLVYSSIVGSRLNVPSLNGSNAVQMDCIVGYPHRAVKLWLGVYEVADRFRELWFYYRTQGQTSYKALLGLESTIWPPATLRRVEILEPGVHPFILHSRKLANQYDDHVIGFIWTESDPDNPFL